MTTPIFKMSGEYFGFITQDMLFDLTNKYIGKLYGQEIWRQDGPYLGFIYENNYILKHIDVEKGLNEITVMPSAVELPAISPAHEPRQIPAKHLDALSNI